MTLNYLPESKPDLWGPLNQLIKGEQMQRRRCPKSEAAAERISAGSVTGTLPTRSY
jgi:hypothetical protein